MRGFKGTLIDGMPWYRGTQYPIQKKWSWGMIKEDSVSYLLSRCDVFLLIQTILTNKRRIDWDMKNIEDSQGRKNEYKEVKDSRDCSIENISHQE